MVSVGTHNIEQLRGMPDVDFGFGTSSALRSALSATAHRCRGGAQAHVPDGTQFVTRPAPAVGTNPGGGIEVAVPAGSASIDWFSGI